MKACNAVMEACNAVMEACRRPFRHPGNGALPSPDGGYWAFWNPIGEPEPAIFCLFAPLNGV